MMRTPLLVALASSVAGTLAAQPPVAPRPARAMAPMLQTATVDIASAFQQRYRAMIEPLVFGRFAIGLAGEYTTEPDEARYDYIAYPAGGCPVERLCAPEAPVYYGYPYSGAGYRAWSFNVHARWYPGALSFNGERQSASLYLGEFIGFHERRTSQLVYYGCPMCDAEPPRLDTAISRPAQQSFPGGTSTYTQVLHGWEPGFEFGVRVVPMRHLVMDIGGRFRLARLEDYQSGTRPGGVDSRLVVAVGVGW